MHLDVRPVEHGDVTRCIDIRIECLGSLVIGNLPPYPGYREEQEASIHYDLDHNPHVRHWKAVDSERREVIAYAKWEIYEHGRPDVKKVESPKDSAPKKVDGYWRLREAAKDYFQGRYRKLVNVPHIRMF